MELWVLLNSSQVFFLYFEIFYKLGEKKVVRSKTTKLESSGRELDLYN